ncbi:Mov34-domain-containing protein [Neocallimastix californiae]|uniref:Mov34-domain-containing protein n=1 Tax=Neocallimastix californiae TaxID=1754190 RepID=A0A1Y2F673_9FUNG|nr:Mov34-domain-containing protein [Neocallimastix californiae]|eukprot:ORY79167.1 Mov34-domain-containing protein [Neocallimastix californiae]
MEKQTIPQPKPQLQNNLSNNGPTTNNNSNNSVNVNNTNEAGNISSTSHLRKIFVPTHLTEKFLEVAKENTEQNLETCGILCGKLENDQLFISTIIIPKQTASSDTCNTLNEIEVLNYQQKHNLLTLGWIHTHPSQTCFLSSVDLHTHFSYQVMLPEAIAIVCSPKFQPSIGYFRLTDKEGVPTISNCTKKGFHPHKENVKLFYDAHEKNNGHVYNIKSGITIIDLRK